MQISKSLALILLATAAFQAAIAGTRLLNGINLFNQGNYSGAAVEFVRAVRGKDARNPVAHYYLAGTLIHLNQLDNALNEYRISYSLDPKGPTAPLCAKAIAFYTRKPDKSEPGKTAPAVHAAPAAAGLDDDEPKIQLPNLPAIPPAPVETPGPAAFLEWAKYDQAMYLTEGLGRKDRAAEQLDQMEEVVKRVEPMVTSCIPNRPQYGESEEHFKQRQAKGKARLDTVLAPYKAELERRKTVVSEVEGILAACYAARAELKIK